MQKYISTITFNRSDEALVSLAYAANKQGLPIMPSTMHRVEQANIDYRDLLKKHILPDPMTLVDGWIGEASGISRLSPNPSGW